ncbi:hypothetical protein [Bacteroides acidifaciens]|uniref:hypothetical protein n=1 Tax=Bacteroides acidifaciens TaxID=85831 RepID=UPI0026F2346C|nr:hypothetical protein [Bacteroides acidifaciens]
MIKEFTHGDILFVVDEINAIPKIPKSLVEYVEKNKSSLTGVDLLYSPRVNYPYTDICTPTGRRRFRPASITVSSFTYDFSTGVKTSNSTVVYEDVTSEVKVYEFALCRRMIDLKGNILHHVEMPEAKKSWWESLPDDATVGYEWTGAYFCEIFKSDINRITFIHIPTNIDGKRNIIPDFMHETRETVFVK